MKDRKFLKMKSSKGITLIALIITVIVMLILAAVAINLTIGDNGIFRKSDEGAQIYKNATNNEATSLNSVEQEMGNLIEQYGSSKEIINFTMKLELTGDVTLEKTYNLRAYKGETWEQWFERMKDSEEYDEINSDSQGALRLIFGDHCPDQLYGVWTGGGGLISASISDGVVNPCRGIDKISPDSEYVLDMYMAVG